MLHRLANFLSRFTRLFALSAICGGLLLNSGAFAQADKLDRLFEDLRISPESAKKIEPEIWQEWSKSGSDSIDFLLERGRKAIANNALRNAIDYLSATIDLAPDFAEAFNLRATAYYLMGEFGLSVRDIEQVLALNPRHFGALSGFALILEKTDKTAQALDIVEQVLVLHPHSEQAQAAKARLSKRLKGVKL